MSNGVNWRSIWDDPVEVFNIIASNEKALLHLRDIEDRLKRETRLVKKTKQRGYIVEGERKQKLLSEIREIDPAFESEIAQLNNSEDILGKVRERVSIIEREIKEDKEKIRKLVSEEKETTKKTRELAARYLMILNEMSELYSNQLKNIISNRKYETELVKALSSGEFEGRVNEFQKKAHLAFERAKENKMLQEQIISYIDEISVIKHQAEGEKNEFENETNSISSLINRIMEFLKGGKRLNKNEMDKETGGLVPKWTG